MFSNAQAVARIESLLQKGEQVIASHRPDPPNVIGFPTLNASIFAEWHTQCLSLLVNLLGRDHVYVTNFEESVKQPYSAHVEYGQGLLRGLKEDIELGLLMSIRSIISADIFTDFIEMADHLLGEGYKDAAAVMIGGTLEGHLRQLCTKHNIDVELLTPAGLKPKKAEQMNSDLAKANIYSKLDQKNVTAWLDLRNKAAHAQYTDYSKEQVSLFLSGVRDFITRNPA